MKQFIISICIFLPFSFFSQLKKEIELVYLGKYIEGKVETQEVLMAPRVSIFDSKNRCVSSTLYNDSVTGKPQQEFKNYYNSNGKLDYSTYGNGIDPPSSKTNFYYNENGLLKSEISTDIKTGEKYSRTEYFYDLNDSIIKKISYTDDVEYYVETFKYSYKLNPPSTKPLTIIEIKKYSNNNLVTHEIESYLNSLKILSKDLKRGWYTEYKYSSNGVLQAEKSYFNDKTSTQFTFYEYDKKGNKILYAWVDESNYGEIRLYTYEYID